VSDADLRRVLDMLGPIGRDALRNVLIREHADRDAIASRLLRHDENGQGWADIIDLLSIYPDARHE